VPFWYGKLMKVPINQVAALQPNVERLQPDMIKHGANRVPTVNAA
jgi:hypothetical protein